MNYLLERGQKCKQRVTTQLTDKKVAGYISVNDKPDSLNQLMHDALNERKVSDKDQEMKKQVTEMLKSIDINSE